jgi:dTMP kinase
LKILAFLVIGGLYGVIRGIMAGVFITFEGIEGSGKSTQIHLLDECLRGAGHATVLTREPGGTRIGDLIRKILLHPESSHMDPTTELLLYEAARRQHIHEVIEPSLSEGRVVLCDRYADATTAYQGAARRIDDDTVNALHRIATGGLMPRLTILLDCPVDWGLGHAMRRNRELELEGTEDRFEKEARDFHERVRKGYLTIAEREPQRVKVVDATGSIDEVHARICKIVGSLSF